MWLMTVVSVFNAAGFSVSLPFLSLYLYQERGLPMTVVGAIVFISGICSAVTQMFGGVLADRLGRRPMIAGTLAVKTVTYSILAGLIAVAAPVLTIVVVYTLMRSLLVMARPAMTSTVVDVTPKERLTESFGLLRIGQNVGWAAGPAAGGLLAGIFSFSLLFGVAAGVSAVTLLVVFLFFKESKTAVVEKHDIRTILCAGEDRRFFVFTALSLLVFVLMGQMVTTLSVFTVDRAGFTTAQFGMLLTLNGAIVVFTQYPVARWARNVSKPLLLSIGSVLYGIGYLTMGWVGAFALAMAGMAVVTLGEMVFMPTTLAVVGELAPPNWRGHYLGYYGLGETIGLSMGPMLGGLLLDAFPGEAIAVWGTVSLLGFIAAVGFQFWAKSYRAENQQSK